MIVTIISLDGAPIYQRLILTNIGVFWSNIREFWLYYSQHFNITTKMVLANLGKIIMMKRDITVTCSIRPFLSIIL